MKINSTNITAGGILQIDTAGTYEIPIGTTLVVVDTASTGGTTILVFPTLTPGQLGTSVVVADVGSNASINTIDVKSQANTLLWRFSKNDEKVLFMPWKSTGDGAFIVSGLN